MTEEVSQNSFRGWAVVDVMGKQRYIGFVTTETYGNASMFRVDVPSLPERTVVLECPEWIGSVYAKKGSTVTKGAAEGYTKLIGAGSIYMMSPCTEAAAMMALEKTTERPMKVVDLAPMAALPEPVDDEEDEQEDPEFVPF